MFKQRVQGFAVGAAFVAAAMVGLPMLGAGSPTPELDEFAESLGVEIIWTDTHPCLLKAPTSEGCHTAPMPNTIFIDPDARADDLRFLVLHEIGHVLQDRLDMERDECHAYRIADAIGGTDKGCIVN